MKRNRSLTVTANPQSVPPNGLSALNQNSARFGRNSIFRCQGISLAEINRGSSGNQGLKVALAMLGLALVISAIIKLVQFWL